jgi:hypothetical protein
MPTLWTPTDNPWEFRRLPFFQSSGSASIDNVGTWTKRDWIEFIGELPDAITKPDTPEQKELLKSGRDLHKGKSKWLEFYELGRPELLGDLLLAKWNRYKPYADFSLAILRFCQQAYLRLEHLQAPGYSHITLWGVCEWSLSSHVLRKSGYYGNPDIDERGMLLGKGVQYQQNVEVINIHKAALKDGEYTGEFVTTQFPKEHILDYVLYDAINFANKHNDEDMEFHCKEFLNAIRHFNWLINNSKQPTIQISSSGIQTPTRGRHSPKGFSLEPKTKRRGRGRPPKGQAK